VRLLYASSAAVYGGSDTFREEPAFERPLNVYGYSKLLFDNVVRRMLPTATTQVAGFRYFNVYGPHEQHKGRHGVGRVPSLQPAAERGPRQAVRAVRRLRAGEQARDFVFVEDVVAVNLWFLAHPEASGIFNLGSGRPSPSTTSPRRSSMPSAPSAAKRRCRWPRSSPPGKIEYIDFPAALVGKYQCFTEADLGRLRGVGCDHASPTLRSGVGRYAAALRAA
jgi:ADP-L-glycero-D-manno-heptose 6-epimerase